MKFPGVLLYHQIENAFYKNCKQKVSQQNYKTELMQQKKSPT